MWNFTKLMLVAITATVISNPVAAQESEDYHPFLSSRFNIEFGAFWPTVGYEISVDGTTPGEEIDFDKAFSLDDNQATPAMEFRWRFGEKWSFWGQYWDTSLDGGAVLDEDVEWEDIIFREGSFVNAGVDMTVVRVFMGRTFSTSAKHEFGLGAGLHWMEIGTFLEGEVLINDTTTEFRRVRVGASFPMPNIGAWYMYSWSPKWLFQSRADWLAASIGDYSGSLWDVQVGVNYQAFKNIGFGLHYKGYLLDVDVDKSNWRGGVAVRQIGPLLTMNVSW